MSDHIEDIKGSTISQVKIVPFSSDLQNKPNKSTSYTMKQALLYTFALVASIAPALAQKPGPIKLPGLGTCPDECISIRVPTTGALVACCGTAEGCIDCAPSCVAACNGGNGRYGGCVDLGNDEDTCSKGCELLCDSTVSDVPLNLCSTR